MKNFIIEDQFQLQVARGKVKGSIPVHKFGAIASLSNNTTGTVWDVNNTLYPWSAFDTPGVLVAAQANASDNGKVIKVIGLDENWEEIEENFTLSSAAAVTGTKTFRRVYRAFIIGGTTNVDTVNVSRGGTVVLSIRPDMGQTLMCIYTIPNGYTGYLYKGVCTTQVGADASGFMYVRYNTIGQAFRVGHTFEVNGGGGEYEYNFAFPVAIPQHSDIDVRVATRSNNGRFTAAFDLLLIKNDTPIPGNTDAGWPIL